MTINHVRFRAKKATRIAFLESELARLKTENSELTIRNTILENEHQYWTTKQDDWVRRNNELLTVMKELEDRLRSRDFVSIVKKESKDQPNDDYTWLPPTPDTSQSKK